MRILMVGVYELCVHRYRSRSADFMVSIELFFCNRYPSFPPTITAQYSTYTEFVVLTRR